MKQSRLLEPLTPSRSRLGVLKSDSRWELHRSMLELKEEIGEAIRCRRRLIFVYNVVAVVVIIN